MNLPRRDEDIFVKPKVDKKSIQNSILLPMDLQTLTAAMIDIMKQEKRKYTVVRRDRLSIKEKLIELKNNLSIGSSTSMDKLINWEKGRDEVVITFISLLELARLQKLDIFQNERDGAIYVEVLDSLDTFDIETADGFDPEDEEGQVDESLLTEIVLNESEAITNTIQ